MKIGIDKLSLSTSNLYLDIRELARARNVDENKYLIGLGQSKMGITRVNQDIVTLGVQAAEKILTKEDKKNIDMVIIGTESGIDQSKAASIYIHNLLDINKYARSIEIKQACYGATAGLQLAYNHILTHPDKKVLVIASDIAKYGVNSSGESTQGAGAIAMLISNNPRIAILNNDCVSYTDDIMDFWRPNHSDYALVDGRLSNEKYLELLNKVYTRYMEDNNKNINELEAICFHIPYPKLGYKALISITEDEKFKERLKKSVIYSSQIGNIYTGSLFLSLLSLLENDDTLKSTDTLGMYSYGSGAVAEFFSITLVEGYEKMIDKENTYRLLENRKEVNIEEYEKIFFEKLENNKKYEAYNNDIYISEIEGYKRIYERKTK